MNCSSCNTPNPEESNYCSKCGSTLNGSVEQHLEENDELIPDERTIYEELEKKHISGSGWFNTIAILSLINTIIVFAKWNFMFPVGLGTSSLAAAIFNYVPDDPDISIKIMRIIGFFFLLMSFVIIGLFFLFRVKAKKGKKWAYITGITIYTLDALICLWMEDWVSAGFHAWGLLSIWNSFSALRQISKMNLSVNTQPMENQISLETSEPQEEKI